MIIHGQKDTIISSQQSIELLKNCAAPSKLIMPEHMTHNDYNIAEDIVKPIFQFLTEIGVTQFAVSRQVRDVPAQMRTPPSVLIQMEKTADRERINQRLQQRSTQRAESADKAIVYEDTHPSCLLKLPVITNSRLAKPCQAPLTPASQSNKRATTATSVPLKRKVVSRTAAVGQSFSRQSSRTASLTTRLVPKLLQRTPLTAAASVVKQRKPIRHTTKLVHI